MDNHVHLLKGVNRTVPLTHYRGGQGPRQKMESTGLGLAIVKHTADRYGGTVRLQSELGKYTRIEVCFPADG